MVNKKQPRSARTSTRKRDERREQARAIARAEQARADAAEKERVRVQRAEIAEEAGKLVETVAWLIEIRAEKEALETEQARTLAEAATEAPIPIRPVHDGCCDEDYAEEDDSEPEGEGEEDDDFDCTRVHRRVFTIPKPRMAGTRRLREW
ncbi:MAG: hypothetical protein A2776_00855 [Candidatus Levybacteria bacterium RIFCSPHIGHO2_01_FULL_40_10]|nr:MAG: hypothetical protein A2776_00855 [Candidatus Levybacteria bacterium RIFCSPHIGHO2_01_FULL_40_10]